MLSSGNTRSKAWSRRNAAPVRYLSIVRLAKACKRPFACSGTMAWSETEDEANRDEKGRGRPALSLLVEPLSPREFEVLCAICDGDSNEEIRCKLDISQATVKYHVTQIFGKLGVQRRTQAVGVAIHLGLVKPDWLQPERRFSETSGMRLR